MSVRLELCAARVRYGPLEALHGVDVAVPAGAVTLLLGRNGAGRTTALRALAGLVPLSAGAVRWDGVDVTRRSAFHRARRGLTLVPDEGCVFPSLTVREHLALTRREGHDGGEERRARVLSVFPQLVPLLDRPTGVLSGGEQRQCALARALASRAEVLLLDEPARGLSSEAAAALRAEVAEAARGGCAVVVAEQLPAATWDFAAVAYLLRRGHVEFAGEPREVGAEPAGPGRRPHPP